MAVGLPLKTTYANGDVYSASDVNDTNGTVNLTAAPYAAGKNKFLNGDFSIWQRGTTINFSAAGGYVADRWKSDAGGGGVLAVTRQAFTPGQTDVPNAIYFLQAAYTTSGTGTVVLEQRIEDVNTFAGQTVTLSFYAKVNTGTKSVTPRLVQDFGSGGSGGVLTNLTAQTLTTSWQRFTITTTVPSISGKTVGTSSYLRIDLDSGTSGVLTFSFANFQVEAGSTATAFQTATGTLQGELAACQRYYWRATSPTNYTSYANGQAYNSTQAVMVVYNPVPMRTGAASIEYTLLGAYNSAGSPIAITSIALLYVAPITSTLAISVASGLTAGNATILSAQNSTSAYLGFSAEL